MNETFYLIHEFSSYVGIPKSTLRYYDKLGFFDIVIDKENNYRFFRQSDSFIVQKIIALKTIGFSLKDIKKILKKQIDKNDLENNIFSK